jgi:uncharacterized protein (TIGR02145 family)
MRQLIISKLILFLLFCFVLNSIGWGQTKGHDDNSKSEEDLTSKYITNSEPFLDTRDGKTYKTIKIGHQVWMAENLAFRMKLGCYVYGNNQENVKKNGYLYEWQSAMKACPDGWSLPKRKDFDLLLFTVSKISKKPSKEIVENGCSGFEATLSGWRDEEGYSVDLYENGNYWTASKSISGRAWLLFVGKKGKKSYLDFAPFKIGMSVRCIKN